SYLSPPSLSTLSPLSLHDALPILSFDARGFAFAITFYCERSQRIVLIRPAPRPALIAAMICGPMSCSSWGRRSWRRSTPAAAPRSEEHTSELQSRGHLVCRLLLEK